MARNGVRSRPDSAIGTIAYLRFRVGRSAGCGVWDNETCARMVDPTRRCLIRCRLEQGGGGDGAAADRAGAASDQYNLRRSWRMSVAETA